jgi:phosphoribosyl-AMP cyclohydrolase
MPVDKRALGDDNQHSFNAQVMNRKVIVRTDDTMSSQPSVEEALDFIPRFDSNGLIPAIAQDAKTGQILMVAYMNQEALEQTLQRGYAVYFSRSRGKLWRKGEESGHVQKVEQVLVDCDQDCLILKVSVDQGQCHTGRQSCFYRAVRKGQSKKLDLIAEKVYDPKQVYRAG